MNEMETPVEPTEPTEPTEPAPSEPQPAPDTEPPEEGNGGEE